MARLLVMAFATLFAHAVLAQAVVTFEDPDAKPWQLQGELVSTVSSVDKRVTKIYALRDSGRKQVTYTEVNQKGAEMDSIVVRVVDVSRLRPVDPFGSRVEVEPNDYFPGKIAKTALICVGIADNACVVETSYAGYDGSEMSRRNTSFVFIYHLQEADARAELDRVMSMR